MKLKKSIRFLAYILLLNTFFSCASGCARNGYNNLKQNNCIVTDDLGTDESAIGEFLPGEKYYTVIYKDSENGRIEGETEQKVAQGESASRVNAVPNPGYVFICWSDGRELSLRTDRNIREDITVYPIFEKEGKEYTVTYETRVGAKLISSTSVTEKAGRKIEYSAPEAPFAYMYGEWNDGKSGKLRTDNATADGKIFTVELIPSVLEVPVVNIITYDYSDITSKTEYKKCAVSLDNAKEEYCFKNVDAHVRGRGNSSWGQPKKSYRIKFDSKRSVMGSDYAAKVWTLIANFSDKTLSRNAIAYEFARSLPNIRFSSMNEFVELFVNGEYRGVYLLCDQIKVEKGRVDIVNDFSEDPADTGYLIEIDNRAPDEGKKGIHYFVGNDNKNYTLKSPDPDVAEYDPKYLKYIEEYVNTCISVLNSKNWEEICEYIDVDSFADGYLAQELFCNLDCHSFSFFLYKDKGGKLVSGPVWDYDIGSGNNNYGLGNSDACLPDQDVIVRGNLWVASTNQWYKRLLATDEFKTLVCERLVGYRAQFKNTINLVNTSSANSYYAMYKMAMERNFIRWDIMGKYVWPNPEVIVKIDTVRGQLDYLYEWLLDRYEVVCDFYDVPVADWR